MMPLWIPVVIAVAEPTVAERIARGRAACDALEFDVAALELGLAARDSRATEAERLEANLWAGAAHRVLGQDTDARLHFLYVLRREPGRPAPADFAPKIADFYALVREEVTMSTTSPAPASAPPEPPPPTGPGLPAIGAVGGSALVLVGSAAVVVGAGPWFAHDAARTALLQAAQEGSDGTEAANRQAAARESWESWGGPLVVGGAIAAALGVVAAGVGGALWVGGP
jgi:hypothetical protein